MKISMRWLLGAVLLALALDSFALDAGKKLSAKEQFYKTSLFFLLTDDDVIRSVYDIRSNYDWVKPILFGLALSGNEDPAPHLEFNRAPEEIKSFCNHFNVLTDLEVLRASQATKFLAEDRGLSIDIQMTSSEIAASFSRLSFEEIFEEKAIELAARDDLDLKVRLGIMFSRKSRYQGYSEVPYSWDGTTFVNESAPRSLRRGPGALIRLYLTQLKMLAHDSGMMDEYHDFIRWMKFEDIDADISCDQDPFEKFRQDLAKNAIDLGVHDLVINPSLSPPTTEQARLTELVMKIQSFFSFLAVVESWTTRLPQMLVDLRFNRMHQDTYLQYLYQKQNQNLFCKLDEARKRTPAECDRWALPSLSFAMSVREELNRYLRHINDVRHHYDFGLAELKQDFTKDILRSCDRDCFRRMHPLKRKILLRWLKNMSSRLGLLRKYQAMVENVDMEGIAPEERDDQDVYQWIQHHVGPHGVRPR